MARYYLDFCAKYDHPPRDRDSLGPFLNKLAAKGQCSDRQQAAVTAIAHFYWLVMNAGKRQAPESGEETSAWDGALDALKREIRLRQYSPKTLKTYLGWNRQFARYLEFKPPVRRDRLFQP